MRGRPYSGIPFQIQFSVYHFPGVERNQLFVRLVECARAAEDAGFDDVCMVDHVHQLGWNGPVDSPMFEPYTALAAIATRTTRVHLGALVTAVSYRNPAHLAKIVTTLDHVSNGRALLGMGAGWYEAEQRAYGFGVLPVAERFERLEEALQLCRRMFTEASVTFDGRHYRTENAHNEPKPIQLGGPPVVIGGSGERKVLRMVAQYADACNMFGADVATIRHKVEVLQQHCANCGRDPAEITKIVQVGLVVDHDHGAAQRRLDELVRARVEGSRNNSLVQDPDAIRAQHVAGDPESIAEQLQPYRDAGVDGFAVSNYYLRSPDQIELAGEVLRAVRARGGVAA